MTNIDVTVKGTYTIENEKGEVLAQVDNAITDHGMRMLAGHPYSETNNLEDISYYFNKGMLHFLYLAPSSGTEILVNNNLDRYSSKIVSRVDNRLQINTTVKKQYTFNASTTITHIRTRSLQTATASSWTTSEAILSPNLSFTTGQTITITYTLQYVTDCNRIISNMDFKTNVSSGVLMPPNKTNVRHLPVVMFPELGQYDLNAELTSWDTPNFYSPAYFRTCLDLPMYRPTAQSTFITQSFLPRFVLYFYSDVDIYDTMVSTTATTKAPLGVTVSPAAPQNYVLIKSASSIKYTTVGNTWSTSIRFLFEPGEWPTTAKGFSLLVAGGSTLKVFPDSRRSTSGIFTALQTPYNPYKSNANMIVGIDYKFNWTRG